jgi:hypothetical protein
LIGKKTLNSAPGRSALFRLRRVAFQRAALVQGTKRQRQLEINGRNRTSFLQSDGFYGWLNIALLLSFGIGKEMLSLVIS